MAVARKAITAEDLWKLERAGGISLSPAGAQAVCSLQTFSMEENKGQSALWLLSTFGGGPRRLTQCGEKDGQAAWSPTGERIAFVAKREQQGKKDETPQLYVIAPDGGEARRVSDYAPGIEAFKWFPDGRRIAFVSWVWPELKGSQAQARRSTRGRARVAHRRPWNLRMSRRVMPCAGSATGSPREKRMSRAWRNVSSSAWAWSEWSSACCPRLTQ